MSFDFFVTTTFLKKVINKHNGHLIFYNRSVFAQGTNFIAQF